MKNSHFKRSQLRCNRRALSPIFATLILAAIVIIFGSVAYYYASNVTSTASNQYTTTVQQNQQSLSERLAFESVAYNVTAKNLTIYLLNCGISPGVQISSVFLYNATTESLLAAYPGNPIFALQYIDGGAVIPSKSLNVGAEGYFVITGVTLTRGSLYSVHLVTQRGSTFDCQFAP